MINSKNTLWVRDVELKNEREGNSCTRIRENLRMNFDFKLIKKQNMI